ncbi:hypothetical protein BV25DRAFT_1843318 [Artomyces pyxidatus]|uniref:Uncharacterized protein n=1 Tax=Artomyces pyxidatus TaxID=48021 RepID=A0ACB8SF76_9AGAM|nr:hypothetical protein BV25DRAFT_1843318 [Artomyces pyxidatus]
MASLPTQPFHVGRQWKGKRALFQGTKRAFLERRIRQYEDARKAGREREFWESVTRLFLLKYGYDLPIHEDLDSDICDPDEALLDDGRDLDSQAIGEEESLRRTEVHKKLLDRIRTWYRHTSRREALGG